MRNTVIDPVTSADTTYSATDVEDHRVPLPPEANHVEEFEVGQRYTAPDLDGGGETGSVNVFAY
ncbi:hypothetical protein [Mycobacterium sp. 236(2023)]|uniref:hypothetical protein n=1 Tax=Mycobacterium sp. 236(2023) TaxID=3038163 RepID=UPI0024157D86|nr:hypothetical protein [Mycobacterium sp. 236(2023)]MDG4667963.1 hypothetical protein [Mycobacterium sp. 236(2023)]